MSAASGLGGSGALPVSRLRRLRANMIASFATLLRTPRPSGRRIAWPPQRRLVLGAVIAVVVVFATMWLLDARSLTSVRQLPPNVVAAFERITDFGLAGWFLWPVGLLLIALAIADTAILPRFVHGVMAALAVRLGFVFAAIAVPGLLVAIVKRLIGRARPPVDNESPWNYQLFVWRPEYASLPSGHATTAFAAAIAIGAFWPRLRIVMWAYAAVIALSRVIVTAHHPSDVVVSAIVGTLGAVLVRNWFAARRLGFVVTPEGGVRRLPGPSFRRIKAVARRLLSA